MYADKAGRSKSNNGCSSIENMSRADKSLDVQVSDCSRDHGFRRAAFGIKRRLFRSPKIPHKAPHSRPPAARRRSLRGIKPSESRPSRILIELSSALTPWQDLSRIEHWRGFWVWCRSFPRMNTYEATNFGLHVESTQCEKM